MKTVFKISAVLILVISLLFIAREKGSRALLRNANKQILESAKGNDTAVFFVGSSRVKYGVNDSLLETLLHFNVHNCAFSNSTFFSNVVITAGVIKQGGNKIIITELSPLIPDIPMGSSEFMQVMGIYKLNTIHQLIQADGILKNRQAYIKLLNQYLVNTVTLENELKFLFEADLKNQVLTGFRYKSVDHNGYKQTDSYLKITDFIPPLYTHPQARLHLKFINYLANLAQQHHTKLYFAMPVLYRDQAERALVRSVFHSLPDSLKITYSPDLIEQVTNATYLYDIMHFNKRGADKFSELLAPVIDSIRRSAIF